MNNRKIYMRFGIGLVLFASVLLGFRPLSGGSGRDDDPVDSVGGATCAPGGILVKFRPDVGDLEADRILSARGPRALGVISGIGVRRMMIPAGSDLSAEIENIRRDPRVEFAEPDYALYAASTIPSDPFFSYQWALRNTGQLLAPPPIEIPSGTPGADIKAAEIWDLFRGSAETLVGVVDTGVDLTHPDLINHIASPGIDFVNNDDSAQDDHGHGTHVAGIIGAETDNGQGVAGINWNVRILPVKVFNRNAMGWTSWVAEGIIWAAQNGARVINMSLGGRDVIVNKTLEAAVKYAYDRNVILVAAAGNDGKEGVWFPAAFGPYVIAAAATDQFDRHVTKAISGTPFGSNYGPEVDVAAPGLDILSSWGMGLSRRGHPGWDGYLYNEGTSMSTAFVSGLAALLVSLKPDLANWEMMWILRASADDVNAETSPGWDIYLGAGRINALKAVRILSVVDYFRGRIRAKILMSP